MAESAQYWHDELQRYSDEYRKFHEKGEKIVKRFRDERKDSENIDARFNILWSNIKTLKPAIYTKPPKPEVSRRFKDNNPVARAASSILERCLDYEITQYSDYHSAMSNCVDDRLLVGRGIAWLRYEPLTETVEAEPQISEDEAYEHNDEHGESTEENAIAGENDEPLERITSETTPVDYVFWKDFAHLPARTWEEITWVGRRVYLGKSEGIERFGEIFNEVPLSHSPDEKGGEKETTKQLKKAEVWEIWCKPERKVYWVAAHFDEILDERDDPLELENFYPCPKPIFATTTTNTLLPVADFQMYQDQANEIDEITGRIQHLVKAMKVMGIYAADEAAVGRLLKEGNDAVMIPVQNWQAFMDKGGLQNVVQFIPLQDVARALQQLYEAREACKQIIYEVTGLSDIVRGASQASETATAQGIKAQYAAIRLNEVKDDVARFARDLLRMKTEVMCSKYQPETLIKVSGIEYTPDAQFAQQAIELLKNEPLRNFSIDIETDTLVQLDEKEEKEARIEFLTSSSMFLEKALQVGAAAPEMTPLLMEMLMFGVRGFSVGRNMEAVFETTMEQMKQAAAQPPEPQPDPEQMKLQAAAQSEQMQLQMKQAEMQQSAQVEQGKMQLEQAKMQLEQQKMQVEAQSEQARSQFEQAKAQADMQLEQGRMALEQQKMQLEQQRMELEASKIVQDADIEKKRMDMDFAKAKLSAETSVIVAQISAQNSSVEGESKEVNDGTGDALVAALQGFQVALEGMRAPKQVVRDEIGRIQGVI